MDQSTSNGHVKPWELFSTRQRWMYLSVLFLVSTSNYIDRQIIGVLIEPIKADFGASDTQMGLLTGIAFAAMYATLGIPIAAWADRGNRKKIVTLAVAVWSGMTALCGLVQSFLQLFLARVGVGAGEAGAIPPAQSLIADYFPPDGRAKALGIFMMSSVAGYAIALIGGGYLADAYGWRVAFIVVGLPGFLLAVLCLIVLREPRNILYSQRVSSGAPPETIWAVFVALWQKRSMRMLTAAMVFYFLMAYGALVFVVPMMVRIHDLSLTTVGAYFGISMVISSIIGNVAGGMLADKLAAKDISWLAKLPGYGLLIAFPIYMAALLMPTISGLLALLTIGGILLTGVLPSMFAALHAVCGSRRRAMAVAIVFFFGNMIGLGLGPVGTGVLSDLFAAQYGPAEGLRIAMLISLSAFLFSGAFMLLSAKHLKNEVED